MSLVLGAQQQARAQAEISTVLVLPVASLSYAAPWIMEDAGIYKQLGLKVETRLLVGVAANNAVINGSADFMLGTAATALIGASKGQPMLMLANMVDRPGAEIVLRKDVADAAGIKEDAPLADRLKVLKGKTIGVAGIGSANHAFLKLMAHKGGLDSERDFTVAIVDAGAMMGAMAAKRIDGFSNSPPFSTEAAVKMDGMILASAGRDDVLDYLPLGQTVLMAMPATCQKQRDKCARMTEAYRLAAQFVKDKPAETLEIIKKRNERMDPAVLVKAWEAVSKTFTTDLRVTTQMLDNGQRYSTNAGLLQPDETIKDFKGLFTDEFLK